MVSSLCLLRLVLSLVGLILSSGGSPEWNSPHRFWDVAIYYRAMQDLRAGLDPYAAGFRTSGGRASCRQHYFTYIYPPLTLLALRAFSRLPAWFAAFLYWTAYCTSVVAGLWAVTRCFRPQEKAVMRYLVPLAIFFPALMPGNNIIGGTSPTYFMDCFCGNHTRLEARNLVVVLPGRTSRLQFQALSLQCWRSLRLQASGSGSRPLP